MIYKNLTFVNEKKWEFKMPINLTEKEFAYAHFGATLCKNQDSVSIK